MGENALKRRLNAGKGGKPGTTRENAQKLGNRRWETMRPGEKYVLRVNGVELPAQSTEIVLTWQPGEITAAVDIKIDWLDGHGVEFEELRRIYADDPVVLALLGYVARSELILGITRITRDMQRTIMKGTP